MKKSDNIIIWWGLREKGIRGKINNFFDLVFKCVLFKIINILKYFFVSFLLLMLSLYYWFKFEFEFRI